MSEACESFKADIEQFENLYELILREIAGKSSKKAYKELYNKEYLKNIEEKEKNFEQEINNIKLHAGAIINSNYWRIDEIKNIYHVFQNEVSEKFGKDLSEFKLEENEKISAYPRLNFTLSTYYKGTGLEEVLKKQEEYLDNCNVDESDITNI